MSNGTNECSKFASDRLLLCCLCKSMLDDPMLLQCLHNCCRQCLENATQKKASSSVTCLICRRATDVANTTRNLFVARISFGAQNSRRLCIFCKENGAAGNVATHWCTSCKKSLCDLCLTGHNWFNKQHLTHPLEELESSDVASASLCWLHKKPLCTACNNCKAIKCVDCQSECLEALHNIIEPSSSEFQSHMQKLRKDLVASECVLLDKMASLKKLRVEVGHMKTREDERIRVVNQKKKKIVDAIERAYNSIIDGGRNAYDCVNAYDGYINNIESCIDREVEDAVSYLRCVLGSDSDIELVSQEQALLGRLEQLLSEIKLIQQSMKTPASVMVDCPLPENLDELISEWLGVPRAKTDHASKRLSIRHSLRPLKAVLRMPSVPPAPPLFSLSSGTIKCSVHCWDVAVLPDGGVLLAGGINGMIEYSSTGHQRSVWKPMLKERQAENDLVKTVEAIGIAQAAAGIFKARTVVLLRRREADGQEWFQERELMLLQSPPHQVSSFDDLVAATTSRFDSERLIWLAGHKLALAPLKDGWVTHRERKYNVWRVAVTQRALITVSCGQVKLADGRHACVIDSHGRQFDEHLWRYAVGSRESVQDMCAEPTGLALYVTVCHNDSTGGKVVVVKTATGKELKGKVLSGDNHGVPLSLSLAVENQLTVLAVLWHDPRAKNTRLVTVQSRLRPRVSAETDSVRSSSRSA